jgi:hypothetical protein
MARGGIARTTTIILALALVILIVGGAYAILVLKTPTNSENGQTSTRSSSASTPVSTSESQQPVGLLDLFGNFSSMSASYVTTIGAGASLAQNLTYVVLGRTLVNSTEFYRVQFVQTPQNSTTILWFDPQGNVTVAESGGQNYTGAFAELYSASITSFLSVALPYTNPTQLLGLQETGGDIQQSVGGVQMTVSTYVLPAPTLDLDSDTVKVGMIPGTGFTLIVYVNQVPEPSDGVPENPDGAALFFQVNSLSK